MAQTGSDLPLDRESSEALEIDSAEGAAFFTHEGLRTFLSINAATVLYALSAVSILYGIAQLFGPLMAHGLGLREAMPCILALTGYELALLGVLLLIVLCRHVTDDAVSLTILIAVFLIVSAIALGVFANRNSDYAIPMGVAVLVLAGAKVLILRGWIGMPFVNAGLGGLLIVLAWDFLSAPFLAWHFQGEVAMNALDRLPWLWTWPALMTGGVLVLISVALWRSGSDQTFHCRVPFLRTPAMSVIFSLVLLAGSGVHAYILAYMFHMQCSFGDFIPLLTLIAFVAAELPRLIRRTAPTTEAVLYGTPLLLWGIALTSNHVLASPEPGPGLLLYPAVAFTATAAYLGWLGWIRRQNALLCLSFVYAIGALLTAGSTLSDPGTYHWHVAGAVVAGTAFVAGWMRRDVYLCWFAVIVASVGLSLFEPVQAWCRAQNLSTVGLVAGTYGFGTIALFLAFAPGLSRAFGVVAAGSMFLFAFDVFPGASAWISVAVIVTFTALCAAVYVRRKDGLVAALIGMSVVYGLYEASAAILFWRFVILGFALLMIGAFASLAKGGVQVSRSVHESATDTAAR